MAADTRLIWLVIVSLVVFTGTFYSVLNETYLDTSNPLLANLPHPLEASHYFARKSNPLNVYFIKLTWAWTSGAFFLLWATSPPSQRTLSRVGKWLLETAVWWLFTAWFFGPAIFDRVIVASGGECILHVPAGAGDDISVPMEFCFAKSTVSTTTHPHLFIGQTLLGDFHAVPRLRRGHDVSGHLFLLTMSILFLVDQLRSSTRVRESWSIAHKAAVALNYALVAIWMFSSWTTSVYFHAPSEKLSGFRKCLSYLKAIIV
jgi:hypothetical protein